MPPPLPTDAPPTGEAEPSRRVARAVGAFVALGLALRLARYALNYPLWGDEAFVAVNFLDRGYRDLLGPLEYGQVCPILFLWIELAAVRLLGFSEWSLRLFPLACGLASVLLFRRAAGLVLKGVPQALAVGIFAVAFHPIRHGSEVKPYASDLLVALAYLTLAFRWLAEPGRSRWPWALAAFTPAALALSHPAAFVAGGVGLALAPTAWKSGDRRVRVAYGAFLLATAGTFLGLFLGLTRSQDAVLPGLRAYWADSFPPLGSPLTLARWAVQVHTGSMFAYPGGGRRGASSLTLVLFLAGGLTLWRSGRRAALGVCLAPFALAFLAAALRRYPYGGEARIMQFLAPSICLLAGLGAARMLDLIPRERARRRATAAALVLLAAGGIGPMLAALNHPYRMIYDDRARAFARSFWPAQGRDAELACVRYDFGVAERGSGNLRTSVYLCNQAIYSPRRRASPGPAAPRWELVTATHPLRCVLPHEVRPESPEALAWLAGMTARLDLSRRDNLVVDMDLPGAPPRRERVTVFEFVPRANGLADAAARGAIR